MDGEKENGTDRSVCPTFLGLAALGMAGMALVPFLYSWGDMSHPLAVRFASAYLPAMCLLAAYPIYRLWQRPVMAGALVVVLAGLLAHGLRVAAKNEHSNNTLTFPRQYKRNLDFLKSYPKDSTLIITDLPGMYVAHRYGAVNFSYAGTHAEQLLSGLRQHLYTNILVIQKVAYKNQQGTPVLNPKFAMMPLLEYQNARDHFVRLSKVLAPSSGALSSAPLPVFSRVGAPPSTNAVTGATSTKAAASRLSRGVSAAPSTYDSAAFQKVQESPEVKKAREEYLGAQKRFMEAMKEMSSNGRGAPQKGQESPQVKKAREEYLEAQRQYLGAVKKAAEGQKAGGSVQPSAISSQPPQK